MCLYVCTCICLYVYVFVHVHDSPNSMRLYTLRQAPRASDLPVFTRLCSRVISALITQSCVDSFNCLGSLKALSTLSTISQSCLHSLSTLSELSHSFLGSVSKLSKPS